MNFVKAIVAAGLVAASTSAFAADITGAGATFPFPVYSKWADAYKKETGNGLNYQSIGSGAGIKQIQAKTVTFGATDAPLKAEQLEKDGLVQWPMVMGAIVPVVNLEGIKPGELVLSGEVLGDIYLGKITKWDDACDCQAQSEAEAANRRDHRCSALGRFGHLVQLHQLSVEDPILNGSPRSAKALQLNGQSALAPRATKALLATSRRPKTPSVMSSMLTPSRTS